MMGVPPATSFLAWFLENAAVMALGSAALAVVLKASGIFAHSNAFLLFLFLLDFGVSAVMLSYLLGACFGRAAPLALCGSLLYLASFLPYVVLLVLRRQLGAAAQMLLVSARLSETPARRGRPTAAINTLTAHLSLRFPSGCLSSGPPEGTCCGSGALWGAGGGRQPDGRVSSQPLLGRPGDPQHPGEPAALDDGFGLVSARCFGE